MKIHIEPTSRVVELVVDEFGAVVPARVWEGHTDNGIAVICCITRVAADRQQDLSELERALAEVVPPSAASIEVIPMRFIL